MEECNEMLKQIDENKEMEAQRMFNNLRSHIDEDIIFTICSRKGEVNLITTLKDVNDFISVIVGDWGIPLIGHNVAVKKITSRKGEVLFFNEYIQEYHMVNSEEDLWKLKCDSFGYKIANSQISANSKWVGYDEEESSYQKKGGRNK